MNRPWHIWTVFGLCLTVMLAALAWSTVTIVRLDRAARRQATEGESVRLALWRMDSALAPLIARESGRPYFVYSSFYPAQRAYTRMFSEIEFGEVLVPSPLLTEVSPYVRLHFQLDAAGNLTSPQVPAGNLRELAEPRYITGRQIDALAARLAELRELIDREALAAHLPLEPAPPVNAVRAPAPNDLDREPAQQQAEFVGPQAKGQQARRDRQEISARNRAAQQLANADGNLWNQQVWSGDVSSGMSRPLWAGDVLLLARRVSVNGSEYVQGCWLDWPAIEQWLGGEVADLFPQAGLEPLRAGSAHAADRALAALPLRFVPGPPAFVADNGRSPLHTSLLIAWFCVLVAAVAVGVLLLGTVALSERRAAFVSAVTHELRTPLTTFCLYTEMLVEGMVPSEQKRRSYLNTLQAEARRLSHLVENVLAYARLERGRAAGRLETVGLSELLSKVQPRLRERAEHAGLRLAVEPEHELTRNANVRADLAAVEQILFNLVDNACKYAAGGDAKLIHVSAGVADRFGVLRVRDHGPGIAPAEAGRLFRPFRKSARDAANSAPGVGLGLALSRRLARAMSGDLRLVRVDGPGACLELCLPMARG